MSKLYLLLNHLSDGQFHSGEALGNTLGVTRGGIWKLIQQARELNLSIESVTNKGYRLTQPLSLLNKDKILEKLFPPFLQSVKEIEIFESLPSTNDYLLKKGENSPKGNFICLSEHQSQGRGRLGRHWVSPFAKNIYLSLLWRFPLDAGELSGLALVTAIAVIKTLELYQITNLKLKWPNDVMWSNKKLAGILIEFFAEAHSTSNTVIGIGLNVDMPPSYTHSISSSWTDLTQITARHFDRNDITGNLLNQLIEFFLRFQTEGLKPFIKSWQEYDLTYQMPVTVIHGSKEIQGIGSGINEKGHLLVKLQNQQIQSFASGEVSLRVKENSLT